MEKNRKILFIIFIFLLLALVGMYQNEQRKTLIIEAKQIVDAEKEKEKLLNEVNNPEINIPPFPKYADKKSATPIQSTFS